jgi:hypothetical protein
MLLVRPLNAYIALALGRDIGAIQVATRARSSRPLSGLEVDIEPSAELAPPISSADGIAFQGRCQASDEPSTRPLQADTLFVKKNGPAQAWLRKARRQIDVVGQQVSNRGIGFEGAGAP